MPCYSPLNGYRSATVNDSGKRSIVFNTAEGFRDLPVTVPCGQCIGCRLERSRQWAVRCTHEAQLHEKKCFVTLTYEDSNLPVGGTLVRRDLQLFLKRLRKLHPPRTILYFGCGEYGDLNQRPHYHACLYGVDFREEWKRFGGNDDNPIFTSETLTALWPHGFSTVGEFSFDTAAYVARYVVKKINGDRAEKHYQSLDTSTGEIIQRTPEFVAMSLKPAIGKTWLEKYQDDVYPRDEIALRGKLLPSIRYYDKKLEEKNPKLLARLKARRKRRAARNGANNTPQRLAVRNEVQTLKLQQLKRKL
ncbi:MAG: replication initiator protein [Microvirus sp.]|nr:MAG: replication initiator protein [Microvirus sp.]